ncbi:MAG: ABC transporter permease [Sporolactobacillus sp.]|jgi:putative spermidine/putrescine transport system permease protein|nr:ABC transporter permease [Sporolactobacillus sp.]
MKRNSVYLLILPGLLFLMLFMIVPLFFTVVSTLVQQGHFSFHGYWAMMKDRYFIAILFATLKISLTTTALCILIGFPVAYYIAKLPSRKKTMLIGLAVFPLLTSAVVRSFSWMIILGKNGMINQFLLHLHLASEPLKLLYTPTAIVIGLTHLFLPLMIISLIGVMENISDDLVLAAESIGASRSQAFRKIVFPLSTPGIIMGSILVFVGSLTAYTTPALLGGKQQVLSVFLYQNTMTLNDWYTASIIATIMMVITFVIVSLMNGAAGKLNPRG